MSESLIPTIEELNRRRRQSLIVSEKAINEHPAEYREIKKLIRTIISKPVDIGEYYSIAVKLTSLLKKLAESGSLSVFNYYYQNIDPAQKGQARYFRTDCIDLDQQLRCIDQMRQDKCKIRVIQ